MNEPNDLICFSHLRWNFVFQRPNHLMERCSRERRVFFVEEPVFDAEKPGISVDHIEELFIVVPRIPKDTPANGVPALLAECYALLFRQFEISNAIAWYYTPMSLLATREFQFAMVVYDCMDQLSAFHGAPPELVTLERELLSSARIVFTGGQSLYEEKRYQHPDVHAFPSSVDSSHFGRARHALAEPSDQAEIPHPRLGFYGVIDERMDLELLEHVARTRPDWQIVMIGPVVKIDPNALPRAPNLHYLGMKEYRELPEYLAGWDVAIMPFAENDATRFISPTKTLEYLAGGRSVVSTPIQDVVHPYAHDGLVRCARREEFVDAVEAALAEGFTPIRARVDALLAATSWDRTWSEMSTLLRRHLPARSKPAKPRSRERAA
jgi:hypothetical protein